jgi:hypothetical protein
VACLLLIAVSAFGQLTGIGNYNFICPYRHEMTHGLVLGMFGLDRVAAFHERGGLRSLGAAGFALGLTLLTKVENECA